MGVALLWTFFCRQVQPLYQRGMTMWMYPMPSFPTIPSP
jgi:hypothetical protein